MAITWEEGQQIIALARQHFAGASAPAGAPPEQPKYGPHNPVLTPEQANTLHLVWSIMGIDASNAGKGSVYTHSHPMEVHNGIDRQERGPDLQGDAAGVVAPGAPDSGADPRPEA